MHELCLRLTAPLISFVIDLELLVEHVKYIKNEIATTEPFKSGVLREIDPGLDTTSDEGIRGSSDFGVRDITLISTTAQSSSKRALVRRSTL